MTILDRANVKALANTNANTLTLADVVAATQLAIWSVVNGASAVTRGETAWNEPFVKLYYCYLLGLEGKATTAMVSLNIDRITKDTLIEGKSYNATVPYTVNANGVDLDKTSRLARYAFKAGHRIRIEVTSSNYLELFPNTNAGIDPNTGSKPIVAQNRIYHGEQYPSHAKLPVLNGL